MKILLAKGADVNAIDNFLGHTALIWAAGKGHIDTVAALIANDANVRFRDKFGFTALDFATTEGHFKVVQLLKNAEAKTKALRR